MTRSDGQDVGGAVVGHDLHPLLAVASDLFLEFNVVGGALALRLHDDIDAALLDDHLRVLAGGQRDSIAVLFPKCHATLDRRAGIERGGVLRLPFRGCCWPRDQQCGQGEERAGDAPRGSRLHDPHGVAPDHLRAAAGVAAGEIERIVLCREQVRWHDYGEKPGPRTRAARSNRCATGSDGRRILQTNSIARKVVRFELQLEPNAIHAGRNGEGRDWSDSSRRRRQNNRHESCWGRGVFAIGDAEAEGSRPKRMAPLTARRSTAPLSDVARASWLRGRSAWTRKTAPTPIAEGRRGYDPREPGPARARSLVVTASARARSITAPRKPLPASRPPPAAGRREVIGLEAFQCCAGELSADIAVNQVSFGRAQARRDLVVGDAGLVEALSGLVGKQAEQVRTSSSSWSVVVAGACRPDYLSHTDRTTGLNIFVGRSGTPPCTSTSCRGFGWSESRGRSSRYPADRPRPGGARSSVCPRRGSTRR